MKLQVSINQKIGVINITSNSFILEDLKAHVCKKMKLNESDFKMKFDFGNSSIELVENVSSKSNLEAINTIKSELRRYWNGLEMDSLSDILEINGRELTRGRMRELDIERDYNYVLEKCDTHPYYIAKNRAKVYLLVWETEEGNKFTKHFLFDMQSEQSVKAFFES